MVIEKKTIFFNSYSKWQCTIKQCLGLHLLELEKLHPLSHLFAACCVFQYGVSYRYHIRLLFGRPKHPAFVM